MTRARLRHRVVRRALFALLGLALSGCATSGGSRALSVPSESRVYIAVFVDESETGEAGVPLSEAVKIEIYRRDPSRLALSFEEGSVALDGTVMAVRESGGDEGRRKVAVLAHARLVRKDGSEVADLGDAAAEAEYEVARALAETEARREEALYRAVRILARELVRRVDRAGQQPAADAAGDATDEAEAKGDDVG
jgi:hypothetical protein